MWGARLSSAQKIQISYLILEEWACTDAANMASFLNSISCDWLNSSGRINYIYL